MPAVPGARGDPLPTTQYFGSVQNCCCFRKGRKFTVKYQRGARHRGKARDTSLLRDLIPAGIWSVKMHDTTTLIEKSIPRARCMQSHGISTSTIGLEPLKEALGRLSWDKAICQPHRWAAWGKPLRRSQWQGRTRHKLGQGKQGAAPLPGVRPQRSCPPWPGCFYSLNPPPIISSPPAQNF